MTHCGYLKITENDTTAEHNFDEKSDFECYHSADTGGNESGVQYSYPSLSDIEVFVGMQ